MPRPAVLVVDPHASRRRELARGLTSLGYEVIPAVDERQARSFVAALSPAVVVAPLGLLGAGSGGGGADSGSGATAPDFATAMLAGGGAGGADSGGAVPRDGANGGNGGSGGSGAIGGEGAAALADGPAASSAAAANGNNRRTLLLLGEREDEGEDLPEEVAYLATGGLGPGELVRRVHVLLLGREVGVEADSRLESLIGDLSLTPFLELLRALQRSEVSGRLVHAAGEVTLIGGQVVAASAGATRGLKAFCRLSHLDSGPVRVVPAAADDDAALGRAGGEREINEDMKSLIIRALEDRVHEAPDPRAKVRLEIGPDFFERSFTPLQKEVLGAIPAAGTVGRLVDALPATDGEVLRALGQLVPMGVVEVEEPEAMVRVVTDSTSDLPAELARAHGIHIVPLLVIFGDRIFHDGIDLGPREFYERLETGSASPRTNPPPRSDFLKLYRESAARQDLFSLHLSEKLSQTVVNARAVAVEARPALAALRPAAAGRPFAIEVADSGSISLGLGLQALFAARMAQRGLDLAEIRRRVEAMQGRMHVLFVVDTLEYLARGGRIGKARALVGKIFGVKPILGVAEGEVVAVDRVRGGRAAHPRLIELFAQRVDPRRPLVVAIGHSKAPIWADRLRALFEERFIAAELMVTEIGPVVGTHAGPGTVGAAVFQPTDEELPLIAPLGAPA
jgi:DegV family protein with EDD domain